MIAKANEKEFWVMYNHPTRFAQSYPDYAPLKGLWEMELRNGECCLLGNNENNARVYKGLYKPGQPYLSCGADDMHDPRALGQARIMVGSAALTYDSVINALESGGFYMSCGPEIHSLEITGNTLKISCSDARYIAPESHSRFARRVSAEGNNRLCQAEFDLTDFFEKADRENMYIHLIITAPDGI